MLAGAEILRRTVEGRHVYFQANRASPIFPELHALLLKTAGIVGAVREALAPLTDDIRNGIRLWLRHARNCAVTATWTCSWWVMPRSLRWRAP
jgi:hypothetical protein